MDHIFTTSMTKKRDYEYLEQRRYCAIKLIESGKTQTAVSGELGVRRQTVSRWVAIYKKRGKQGLKKAAKAGRKSRLSENKFLQIEVGLKAGPEVFGYPNSLWTNQRVAHLIEMLCGVKYHPDHIYRILAQRGLSSFLHERRV